MGWNPITGFGWEIGVIVLLVFIFVAMTGFKLPGMGSNYASYSQSNYGCSCG